MVSRIQQLAKRFKAEAQKIQVEANRSRMTAQQVSRELPKQSERLRAPPSLKNYENDIRKKVDELKKARKGFTKQRQIMEQFKRIKLRPIRPSSYRPPLRDKSGRLLRDLPGAKRRPSRINEVIAKAKRKEIGKYKRKKIYLRYK